MSNEFQHKDPGTQLTQAEYVHTDGTGHILESQATGDVIYAASGTVLRRLGIGTSGHALVVSSGVPAWSNELLATDIKIGEDDQTKIDFEDANTINFYANNAKEVAIVENAMTPGTNNGTALGTTSLMWSDLFLADGAVLNFNNGDITLTHGSNILTFTGGTLEVSTLTIGGTGIVAQATASAVGGVELATTAEINTSTDASRVMTPDAFAASNYGMRYVQVVAKAAATALTVADGIAHVHIPVGLNGMDLAEVHAEVQTAPVGSTIIIEVSKNGASTQMLSTNITIDASETGSDSAATAAVIKSDGTEAVATNDVIHINVTQVGSSTAGSGLIVTLGFRIP